jgi:hypothetical protein
MASSITEQFYRIGGYNSDLAKSKQPGYIAESAVTGDHIPMALETVNRLLEGCKILALTDDTTGNVFDDRIIALTALSFAEEEYDRLHNVGSGSSSAAHRSSANDLILAAYGVRDRYGRLVFPVHADDMQACSEGIKTELNY